MRRALWSFVGPMVSGLAGYVVATAVGAGMLLVYVVVMGEREAVSTLGMEIVKDLWGWLILSMIAAFLFFLVYRLVLAAFRASGWRPFVGLAICIGTLVGWLSGIPDAVTGPTEFATNEDFATMTVAEIMRHNEAPRPLPGPSLQTVLFWTVTGSVMSWTYWAIERIGFARLSPRRSA